MDKLPTLQDSFSAQGVFWLPGKDGEEWAGQIKYDPKSGAKIKLIFIEPKSSRSVNLQRIKDIIERPVSVPKKSGFDVLNGLLFQYHKLSSCPITLINCRKVKIDRLSGRAAYELRNGVNYRRASQFEYVAETIILGRSFADKSAIEFQSLSVNYSSLQSWLSQRLPHTWTTEKERITDISFPNATQVLFKHHIASIESEISAMLITNITTATHQAQINQNYEIRITPNSPRSLEWFNTQIRSIRNLLAFLVGFRTETISIGYKEGSAEGDISIIQPSRSASINAVGYSEMLMPLSRLEDCIDEVLNTWFEKRERLEVLAELSLGVIYKAHQFNRFEFLALTQALKAYHQIAYPGCKEKDIEMSKKCGEDILRDASIKTRIRDLYQKLPEVLKEFAKFDEDVLSEIVNSRNYYTHYPDRLRKKALTDGELKGINILLLRLIFLIMYNELGISEEKINQAFYEGWYNPTLLLGMPLP